ncbi:MAG: hypothetical protein KAH22_07385 [Thiotrichaceae bacterium]|nr:hypothetical protein [Thiotrichaceae bacterium]
MYQHLKPTFLGALFIIFCLSMISSANAEDLKVTCVKVVQKYQKYGSSQESLKATIYFTVDYQNRHYKDISVDLSLKPNSRYETSKLQVSAPKNNTTNFKPILFSEVGEACYRKLVGAQAAKVSGMSLSSTTGLNLNNINGGGINLKDVNGAKITNSNLIVIRLINTKNLTMVNNTFTSKIPYAIDIKE